MSETTVSARKQYWTAAWDLRCLHPFPNYRDLIDISETGEFNLVTSLGHIDAVAHIQTAYLHQWDSEFLINKIKNMFAVG